MVFIVEYSTVGIEVFDDEYGPTIGYDCIDKGLMILPEEHIDVFAGPDYSSVNVLYEVQTIGM